MNKLMTITAALALSATLAAGQSASVTVAASSTSVAPGGSVTITLQTAFDTNGAGGGLFGAPGFYGFGGTVTATGDAVAGVSGGTPTLNGQLAFGPVANGGTGASVATGAAGRGLAGGLANPGDLMTFDLLVDSGAQAGEVTLDFDGAVVLVLGSSLTTFSTDPGPNQQTLTTTSVTITIGSAGCNDADLVEPYGILDLSDINAFVIGFLGMDPSVDFDNNGLYDLADINTFVTSFVSGCP
jgi:hypothetical protein